MSSATSSPYDNYERSMSVESMASEYYDKIPLAGSTLIQNTQSSEGVTETPPNTWESCSSSIFNLRVGPNYDRFKNKAPSSSPFMELVAVDLIGCDQRIDHIGSKVKLPNEWTDRGRGTGTGVVSDIPSLFIVNVQIPSESVVSIFREITDGPGFSLVLYFLLTPPGGISHMKIAFGDITNPEILNILSDNESISLLQPTSTHTDHHPPPPLLIPPALSLLQQYLTEAPSRDSDPGSPWRGRFKVMVHGKDIETLGLPSFITSYNAKPVLIRQTGDGYVEMDINVHKFGALPKKALGLRLWTYFWVSAWRVDVILRCPRHFWVVQL
eukprot:gene7418-15154_t